MKVVMNNHYVYLLQNKVNGMCYIGVRSCKCSVWYDNYMGSSTVMTKEDKDNCNKIILKRFSSREEAVSYEIEMHEKFDVANNELFYNQAKQTSKGFDTTGVKVKHSKEHLAYLAERRKEYNKAHGNPGSRPMTEETKQKLSNAGKEWHKHNTSKLKGRKLTEEHKKKINPTGRTHDKATKEKIKNTNRQNATKHKGFKSWWYEVNGTRTEVRDMTIREFSEQMGVNFNVVKDRFRTIYEGKEKQSEPLKGYIFGRLE